MKFTNYFKRAFLLCFGVGLFTYAGAQTPVWSIEAELFDEKVAANPNDQNNFPKVTHQEDDECYTSGCAFLENISANSYVVYKNINIATEGTYELWMYYMLNDVNGRGIGVTPNYQSRDTTGLWITDQTGSWNGAPQLDLTDPDNPTPIPGTGGSKIVKKLIYLQAGMNMLKIGGSGNGYTPNFDKLELYSSATSIPKPANVSCSWHWDYTDESGVVVTLNGSPSDDIKKVYDNDDETFCELAGNAYVDFTFETDMRFTGFLIFTERANPIDADDFELQGRESESASWVNASKTATDARGQGSVYQTNLGEGMYKYFRLQLKKEASETVKLSEIQFFGYPDVNIADQPDYPITYPEDLIQVRIDGYRTENEVAVGLNGIYSASSNGLINVTNKWFECASRIVDGKRNTKFTLQGSKTFTVQFTFDEPVTAKSYSLAMCAQNNMERNPAKWTLEASEDWGENWITVATHVANNEAGDKFIFPRCNYNNIKFPIAEEFWDVEYSAYKLTIENNGGSDSHISEFQLLGDPIYTGGSTTDVVDVDNTLKGVTVYAKDGRVFIQSAQGDKLTYNVYSLLGSVVKSGTVTSLVEAELPQGIYIVKVTSAEGADYTSKIIVF